MEYANEDLWRDFVKDNRDGYGGAIVAYAQRWAELMEAEMARGKRLEDIAHETSRKADTEGITGFMYGAAVSTLAKTWAYGEALRRWHNQEMGHGNASGVINPAIVAF